MLEPRLKAVVGRTIHQEIQHAQIEKVKDLLQNTDLSLKQISHQSGFKYTQHLARVFRQTTGETLVQFRKHAGNRRYM